MIQHKTILQKSIGALIIASMLFSCKNDLEVVNIITKKDSIPDIQAKNYSILYSDSCKILFNLKAQTIRQYSSIKEPFTEFTEGVNVVYFSTYPDTSSMFRADYAIRYDKEARWETKGNIVAKNVKGEILNTEFLEWNEATKKIYSDNKVIVTSGTDIIKGTGFEADQDFTNWKIKNVSGILSFEQ